MHNALIHTRPHIWLAKLLYFFDMCKFYANFLLENIVFDRIWAHFEDF